MTWRTRRRVPWKLGAEVLLPPEAVNNGEAAILADPTGAPFGVQQWPRPEGGDR